MVNRSRGSLLGTRVRLADRWWYRLRGLLGTDSLPAGEGMLLSPCRAIHMKGMRYALDVAMLDREGRVVGLYAGLAPGGRTALHRDARYTLELPSGTLAQTGTRVGDVLEWDPAPDPASAPGD